MKKYKLVESSSKKFLKEDRHWTYQIEVTDKAVLNVLNALSDLDEYVNHLGNIAKRMNAEKIFEKLKKLNDTIFSIQDEFLKDPAKHPDVNKTMEYIKNLEKEVSGIESTLQNSRK